MKKQSIKTWCSKCDILDPACHNCNYSTTCCYEEQIIEDLRRVHDKGLLVLPLVSKNPKVRNLVLQRLSELAYEEIFGASVSLTNDTLYLL